jgi:hypothetical protein
MKMLLDNDMQTLLDLGIEGFIAVAAIEALCFARDDMLLRAFVNLAIVARLHVSGTYFAKSSSPSGIGVR